LSGKQGDNYNRNNIQAIRSMVCCNSWYAAKVSKLDPDMLSFSLLLPSLFEQQAKSQFCLIAQE
jgi:hypothetical protein